MAKSYRKRVREKYERNTIPDPNNYFIKDYPYYTSDDVYPYYTSDDVYPFYTTGYYYPLPVIALKYVDPYSNITKSPPEKNVPRVYHCALCNKTFNAEDELDKHMYIARH